MVTVFLEKSPAMFFTLYMPASIRQDFNFLAMLYFIYRNLSISNPNQKTEAVIETAPINTKTGGAPSKSSAMIPIGMSIPDRAWVVSVHFGIINTLYELFIAASNIPHFSGVKGGRKVHRSAKGEISSPPRPNTVSGYPPNDFKSSFNCVSLFSASDFFRFSSLIKSEGARSTKSLFESF